MPEFIDTKNISTGVVGLGLMGCSITTCLLIAGHPVIAVAPIPDDLIHAMTRIQDHLERSYQHGLIGHQPAYYLQHLILTEDYQELRPSQLVIECTIEN